MMPWRLDTYPFAEALKAPLQAVVEKGHGDLARWQQALDDLPPLEQASYQFEPMLAAKATLSTEQQQQLTTALKQLHPWRKGPFELGGVYIDTEWRSDWKWQRVLPHIAPLSGRKVLDVGCGNGYYLWRMAGEGAQLLLGVDPMWLFRKQFEVLRFYFEPALTASQSVEVLPIGIDDFPADTGYFDTVFSMGVLYHRRDPVAHLQQLLGQLRPGGELVLETLVIESDAAECLSPEGRYAQMRNVHALPSVPLLLQWAEQAGGKQPICVDEADTSLEEQRQTAWMWFHSLAQYSNPADPSQTIEGYPAPRRAVVIMQA